MHCLKAFIIYPVERVTATTTTAALSLDAEGHSRTVWKQRERRRHASSQNDAASLCAMLATVCNPSPAAMVQGLVSVFISPCHLFLLCLGKDGRNRECRGKCDSLPGEGALCPILLCSDTRLLCLAWMMNGSGRQA